MQAVAVAMNSHQRSVARRAGLLPCELPKPLPIALAIAQHVEDHPMTDNDNNQSPWYSALWVKLLAGAIVAALTYFFGLPALNGCAPAIPVTVQQQHYECHNSSEASDGTITFSDCIKGQGSVDAPTSSKADSKVDATLSGKDPGSFLFLPGMSRKLDRMACSTADRPVPVPRYAWN